MKPIEFGVRLPAKRLTDPLIAAKTYALVALDAGSRRRGELDGLRGVPT